MKKLSIKYLWIYTIALFSVAFVLILISAMQQKRVDETVEYYKQQVAAQQGVSEGVQRTADNLTEENDYLADEIAKERLTNKRLLNTINENAESITDLNTENNALKILCLAQRDFIEGNYADVRDKLKQIDSDKLDDDLKEIYSYLNSRVNG